MNPYSVDKFSIYKEIGSEVGAGRAFPIIVPETIPET